MMSALSLGSPESPRPCFIPLAVKGFFPCLRCYESPWWMSAFSALTDVILITLGNNKLAGNSGDLEPWEESEWSFILLHVAWLTLITAFFSLLFN